MFVDFDEVIGIDTSIVACPAASKLLLSLFIIVMITGDFWFFTLTIICTFPRTQDSFVRDGSSVT